VLTEFESDAQGDCFQKRIAEIAGRAGVSYSTTARMLKRLQELKLVSVTENLIPGTKSKAANTYRLTSVTPLRSGIPNVPSVAKSQLTENKKQSPEKSDTSSILVLNLQDAERHLYWRQFKAFCESKRGSPTLKGFQTWLKKQPPPKPLYDRMRSPTKEEYDAEELPPEMRAKFLESRLKLKKAQTTERKNHHGKSNRRTNQIHQTCS
jgi:hypothetical protein